MANVNVKSKTVTKTVEVEEEVFVLTLNRDEARVLAVLSGSIAGVSKSRDLMNGVFWSLVPHFPKGTLPFGDMVDEFSPNVTWNNK